MIKEYLFASRVTSLRAGYRYIAACMSFALVFFLLQQLLMPKYAGDIPEGNLIREYYSTSKDHSIIFIGDCEVFAGISPIVLWEEYGITSFIRGSAQQLVWQSYYLLEETLRHEIPELIVFSVLAMQYSEPQYEPFNRLTLDGMRLSISKIRSIRASRLYYEDWLSYFFPLFRFKDRWREITIEDFRYLFTRPQVSINGFMVRTDVMPAGWIPDPIPRATLRFGDMPFMYLQKISSLLAEHNVPLLLIKAPTIFPYWHTEWNEQMAGFAYENGISFINFLNYLDEIGLDFRYDTRDGGSTLNLQGAEKFTLFLGQMVSDMYRLTDRRNDIHAVARWQEKAMLYNRVIERQLREIETYGRIIDFLVR